MKPTFFKCEDCGMYFDSSDPPDGDEADGIALDEVEFRYGSDGWEQDADGHCGCREF
jgi:hypothetical protein